MSVTQGSSPENCREGRWPVVGRLPRLFGDQDSTPIGINTPVGSREMAQRLWENHTWGRGATPSRRQFAERKWP